MLACLPRIARLFRIDPRAVDDVWSVSEVITDDEDGVTMRVHSYGIKSAQNLFLAMQSLTEAELGYKIASQVYQANTTTPGVPPGEA